MKFKILSYKSVESTNTIAINLIRKNNYKQGFVHALEQRKGRGRCGKKWISMKGNFFGSIFFQLKKNYPSTEEFNIINPMLNIEILSNYCGKNKRFFKWPNDIYINKKKICGILQEVITKESKKYLIVGIGINLLSNPNIKNYPSTNIFKETKQKLKVSKMLSLIVTKYENFFSNLNLYNFKNFKMKSKKSLMN